MKIKKISLIAALAMFTYSASFAQSKQTLNLKKGQKYVVENKSVTQSTTEVQGQQMEVNVDATTTYQIEVTDAKDNNFHLANKITNVKMNMSQMGQEMTFDSDKQGDLDGPIGAAMKDMINVTKQVVLNNEGKVVKPEGDTSEEKAMNPQIKQFEASGYGAAIAFHSLPKDMKAGQTWKNSSKEDGTSKNTTYTVKSINGNLATLTLTGDVDVNAKMENMGMEMTTIAKGKFTGEEVVDTKTGVIQSQNMVITSDGNIEVMGQELPTSSKVTSTTTVKAL